MQSWKVAKERQQAPTMLQRPVATLKCKKRRRRRNPSLLEPEQRQLASKMKSRSTMSSCIDLLTQASTPETTSWLVLWRTREDPQMVVITLDGCTPLETTGCSAMMILLLLWRLTISWHWEAVATGTLLTSASTASSRLPHTESDKNTHKLLKTAN